MVLGFIPSDWQEETKTVRAYIQKNCLAETIIIHEKTLNDWREEMQTEVAATQRAVHAEITMLEQS